MAVSGGLWCALFFQSDSPGKVFRWIERRYGKGEMPLENLGLLLSDAAPPQGWRALVGGAEALSWMEASGPAFSEALPPAVTLLFADEGDGTTDPIWGFRVWRGGDEVEQGRHVVRPKTGFLALLMGLRHPMAGPHTVTWAAIRHLPVQRVPALPLPRPVPVVDYHTVAGLDERGLLHEDSPRLYRFSFASSGGSEASGPGQTPAV